MAFGKKTGGRQKGVPNKANRDLKELARSFTGRCLEELERIAFTNDDDDTRLKAIGMILDRGHGKPAQAITGEGGEGAAKFEITWLPSES